MSPIRAAALVALSAVALPATTGVAQVIVGRGMQGVPSRQNPGAVHERNDIPLCHSSGGGSRVRSNCDEPERTATVRTEQEIKFLIDLPPPPKAQCSASTTTEYQQRDTAARVDSILRIADCTSASGTWTFVVRVRDESGAENVLEFDETWQRSDDRDVLFAPDYPIGENVELVSVRVRGLRCECADQAAEAAALTPP